MQIKDMAAMWLAAVRKVHVMLKTKNEVLSDGAMRWRPGTGVRRCVRWKAGQPAGHYHAC